MGHEGMGETLVVRRDDVDFWGNPVVDFRPTLFDGVYGRGLRYDGPVFLNDDGFPSDQDSRIDGGFELFLINADSQTALFRS
jgi:hypothetical protein